jgi:uncharacterized protein
MTASNRIFLSAEWRVLVMLNYEVDPALLNHYVPKGTRLDSFNGRTYMSLVGFRFCHTKMFGRFPIPLHTNFDEINLRFYVRRNEGGEIRRGVVFISEIVPRRAIATTARLVCGENYTCLPMRHRIETGGLNQTFEYEFRAARDWCKLWARTTGAPLRPSEGSLEQFITEHYWGYSSSRGGNCMEYHVSHEPWKVWTSTDAGFEGDASSLYGNDLARILKRHPDSAFVADGSPVIVFKGNKI